LTKTAAKLMQTAPAATFAAAKRGAAGALRELRVLNLICNVAR
jgi:hypothetical protein